GLQVRGQAGAALRGADEADVTAAHRARAEARRCVRRARNDSSRLTRRSRSGRRLAGSLLRADEPGRHVVDRSDRRLATGGRPHAEEADPLANSTWGARSDRDEIAVQTASTRITRTRTEDTAKPPIDLHRVL